MARSVSLVVLPIELLYEIQLFAASPSLPLTCKALYGIFSASPPSYRAQYLVAAVEAEQIRGDVIPTKILRYSICTADVFDALFRISSDIVSSKWRPELPRRLFRSLTPKSRAKPPLWTDQDHPLPFLNYLFSCPNIHPPNVNSHEGYALTKGVQVGFVPLVRFLLNHGASPRYKNSMPILVAIHRKDLSLVRLLVERVDLGPGTAEQKQKGKKRKLEDRAQVTPEMLKAAVKLNAWDIVEYFTKEKGCVPDMQTLLMMR
ncbi:hypothetical protein K503DRAFT_224743 [Rhizopogon vinicolor AM-OR11-026]|uniref:Ankyrin n=1 Tax=Rhizopogon vinicolor AM-OR11-026 TaxID=1314800 RepID=A0A1B7MYE0_9AGAM|nr:hypothetical protein K503DRAFT_224743 [Rhizopogon vinicolor AM-OR11-026]